jgi:chromosome segregation ATPase
VNGQANPDERFKEVDSTLNQLANSQRHLLTAQVLMNDRMERAEKAIQQQAEQGVKTDQRLDRLAERVDRLAEKIDSLADSVKHTDTKLEALADIVRRWYERHGNGAASN